MFAIKQLDWDSKHFGFPVAEVTVTKGAILNGDLVSTIHSFIKDNKIRLIMAKIDSSNVVAVNILERMKFNFVEDMLHFGCPINNFVIFEYLNDGERLVEIDNKNKGECLKICEGSFLNSRFYKDTNFDRRKVDDMYKSMILSSMDDPVAKVYGITINKKVAGFIIRIFNEETGVFAGKLMAVSPEYRGRCLSNKLYVYSYLQYYKDNGIGKTVRAIEGWAASTNQAMLKVFMKSGMRIIDSAITLHRWVE